MYVVFTIYVVIFTILCVWWKIDASLVSLMGAPYSCQMMLYGIDKSLAGTDSF